MGLELPPIPLTCLPNVSKFQPQLLQPHLVPHPRQSSQSVVSSGPFLFTPIQTFGGGGSARSSGRRSGQPPVSWVAGEVGEVQLTVSNPLVSELRVTGLSLDTEGVDVDQTPTTMVLPPMSGPTQVTMSLTPMEAGTLTIQGYTHTVLGVRSQCPMSEPLTVSVMPPLPLVTMEIHQMLGDQWTPVHTSPVHLYSGETLQFRLTITNVGKQPVGDLEVECSLGETSSSGPVIQVKTEAISSSLPLDPGETMTVMVDMTGVVDTVNQVNTIKQEEDNLSSVSDSRWSFSLPSSSMRSSERTTPGPGHMSLVSVTSAGSDGPLTSLQTVNIRVQYSGGHDGGQCRRCVQVVSLVQIPSLIVTRWDVLPGDTQHNCFLVLDLVNRTPTEMELRYTEKKSLLIEPGDMCRVPVPVTKASHSDSLEWEGGGAATVLDYLARCVHLAWSIVTQEPMSGAEITR